MRLLLGFVLSCIVPVVALGTLPYHAIEVIDQETKRPVPLVELETTSRVRYVTDSAGRIAFLEPELMGQDVFFNIRSHGYEVKADGFGMRGIRFKPTAGGRTQIALKRLNIAERLYRLTGEGIYRDSILLGEKVAPAGLAAGVVGQDSAQVVKYNGKLHWFWGDTSHLNYPLGNFRTCGAVVTLNDLNPDVGLKFNYFTNAQGLSKQMCPFEPKDGVVWIDGLTTTLDAAGAPKMVTRFTRLKGLGEPLEQGIALWNDDKNEFEKFKQLDMTNKWQCPRGQSLKVSSGTEDHIYFCAPFPTVRVKNNLQSISSPDSYEAWTPIADGGKFEKEKTRLARSQDGKLLYRWTNKAPPISPQEERDLLNKGLVTTNDLRFLPSDVDGGKRPVFHGGNATWNDSRKRYVMIANELGGTSMLGEVWYAEADALTGPWSKTKKIATHERYDFYNPVHHSFLDKEGGKTIYFEGTYTYTFAGHTNATPRYEYNQLLYRLNLEDERLKLVR